MSSTSHAPLAAMALVAVVMVLILQVDLAAQALTILLLHHMAVVATRMAPIVVPPIDHRHHRPLHRGLDSGLVSLVVVHWAI